MGLSFTDTEAGLFKNITEKCVSANSFVKLTKNFGLVFIPTDCPEFKQQLHTSATQKLNYWAESRVDSTEPANQEKGTIRLTNRDKRENKSTKRTLKKKGKRRMFFYLLFLSVLFTYTAGSKCLKHPVHQNGNWMKCVGPISLFENVLKLIIFNVAPLMLPHLLYNPTHALLTL